MVRVVLKTPAEGTKALAFPKGDDTSVDPLGNLHVFAANKRIGVVVQGLWQYVDVDQAPPAKIRALPAPEGSNE